MCQSLYFKIKLQARGLQLINKEILPQVFSCEFLEISKNTFSYRTLPLAASVEWHEYFFMLIAEQLWRQSSELLETGCGFFDKNSKMMLTYLLIYLAGNWH